MWIKLKYFHVLPNKKNVKKRNKIRSDGILKGFFKALMLLIYFFLVNLSFDYFFEMFSIVNSSFDWVYQIDTTNWWLFWVGHNTNDETIRNSLASLNWSWNIGQRRNGWNVWFLRFVNWLWIVTIVESVVWLKSTWSTALAQAAFDWCYLIAKCIIASL